MYAVIVKSGRGTKHFSLFFNFVAFQAAKTALPTTSQRCQRTRSAMFTERFAFAWQFAHVACYQGSQQGHRNYD